MTNNKLKNMIENHELDDFIYNDDLNNKLRNSKTFEEVLELLKKYNYNESKEVFDVELMDLLKEFVDEEELLKVSGGKLNKQSFSNIITSLAVAGSLCMPVQGVTGVSNSEKAKNKKSSYSVGLPPKEKVVTGATGVVLTIGLGTLLFRALANKSEKTSKKGNEHEHETNQLYTDITEKEYTEMTEHFIKLATTTDQYSIEVLNKYSVGKLRAFIFRVLEDWVKNVDTRCVCVEFNEGLWYGLKIEEDENEMVWEKYLDLLLAARTARLSLLWQDSRLSTESAELLLRLVCWKKMHNPSRSDDPYRYYYAYRKDNPEQFAIKMLNENENSPNLGWYYMLDPIDNGPTSLTEELTHKLLAITSLSKSPPPTKETTVAPAVYSMVNAEKEPVPGTIERMRRLFANTEFSKCIGYTRIMEAVENRSLES